MLRQVSSRNHRTKGGFRAKSALQICILVAVCVWLLYQMKYSHDHKAFDEKFRVEERQSEFSTSAIDALTNGVTKLDRSKAQNSEHHEDSALKVDRDGKKLSMLDGQEHEEQSHEAQEQNFKGDDQSREAVGHRSQELEHEERTRAREKSFRADDVSSSVDHIGPVKDAESESGVFVSAKEINTSMIHEHNRTRAKLKSSSNGTKQGVESTTQVKKLSSNTTEEFDENMEEQSELEIAGHSNNETLTFEAKESEKQIELGLLSGDLSRNQTNGQNNSTTITNDPEETWENSTTVEHDLQHQARLHPLRDPRDVVKLEIPSKKNNSKSEVMVNKKSDQTVKPLDTRISLHNVTAEEKRDER